MNPEALIISLAVVHVLLMVVVGWKAWAILHSGRRSARQVEEATRPVGRIRRRLAALATDLRVKSGNIVARGRQTKAELDRKWQTARELVEEVVHPQRPEAEVLADRLAQGRQLAERLARLHAAARKAAGLSQK